ncbi:uncharacterized protein EV154DRAFT_545019 [Mucor mucedo]|uniref:uncharacterized protein n=1 Tax=Mucor mucedo TaxID=29922 RepID=UPI00221E9A6B|nr:uncharacterized protein EV154DRAFT_545019 [Mucor mucedo]KAI7888216.1 hypothetical protein EV154DRAFT_545019 [Mucor mucedo]
MALLKLPSEILEDIIHLSSAVEKKDTHQFHGWRYPEYTHVDLKNIALCCRYLYILVAPFLWRYKEFILPREDDEKHQRHIKVQMATDLLSKRALFQKNYALGDYVRSLSRDLTNGPHYDLSNSQLMAQLVVNLRALRIDFHPKERSELYGLRYFFEYCPHLSELYLTHCRDTFDDFLALIEFQPPLISLTLTDCTIKESTFAQFPNSLNRLQHLLLQQVLIEPSIPTKSNTHLIDPNQFIHPFHYLNSKSTPIPSSLYQSFFTQQSLTHLALNDSVSHSLVSDIVHHSPLLEKLAIVLHDLDPLHVSQCIHHISQLSRLSILSLAFRKYYPLSKECEKLPCHVPSATWLHFASHFPHLTLLYISATRLLVDANFIPTLLHTSPHLSNIIIHNMALVVSPIDRSEEEENVRDMYLRECESLLFDVEDWTDHRNDLYTYEEAKERGYRCFDETDRVCFIKGFL